MLIIGIAGGVASGKSLVADLFRQLGAGVLDADRAGHEVLCREEVRKAIRERWGDAVFASDGRIDRARLARIVFAPTSDGSADLAELERITHPRIGRLIQRQADELAASGFAAAVLDAPVMFKAGWDRMCDKIIFVDAPRDSRLAWAKQRGWTEQQFDARESAQTSLDTKRAAADVVVDNSKSPQEIREQVERFWHAVVRDEV